MVTLFSSIQTSQESKLQQIRCNIEETETHNEARITALEPNLTETEARNEARITSLESKITALEGQLNAASATHTKIVHSLENELDNNYQYERRDTIIFSGPEIPTVTPDEKPKEILQSLVRRHLKFNISLYDISVAHRLGHKPANTQDKRNITFKLYRRDLVSEIFESCKQFKDMEGQQPFYVNSSLTPIRNKLFYIFRQIKQKYHKKSSHANRNLETYVVAYVQAQSSHNEEESTRETRARRLALNTRQDMESFARDVLQCSFDGINFNW